MANLKVLNINGTAYNVVDAEGRSLINGLDNRLKTAEGSIASYGAKIGILIGEVEGDDTKSVRTISAEEVAKIVAGADANFDTLKEIADWIKSDTTGAAKMANDIAQNTSDIKAISDGLDEFMTGIVGESNDAGTIFDQLTSINSELESIGGGAGSIANQIKTEIEKLDAEVTSTGGTNVEVKVTEVDGKITAVAITKDESYKKPTTGIGTSDLASGVVTSLGKADTAYQKPTAGIGTDDLASDVNASLGKADSSVQSITQGTNVNVKDHGGKNYTISVNSSSIQEGGDGFVKASNAKSVTDGLQKQINAIANGVDNNFSAVETRFGTNEANINKALTATKETFVYDSATETLTITSSAV